MYCLPIIPSWLAVRKGEERISGEGKKRIKKWCEGEKNGDRFDQIHCCELVLAALSSLTPPKIERKGRVSVGVYEAVSAMMS